MWPVILRELRAGSRRWTTYWLRLLAAFAVVLTILLWLSGSGAILARQPGREVFMQMHWVIFAAIWIIVPLLTADCLSREKREGTLGLLFLTDLRAWSIVFAKVAAAGLLALTLWLSAIPIITVPILLGGLPASEVVISCSLALGSICLALAAGLMASSISTRASAAVACAIVFSALAHLAFALLVEEVHYRVTGTVSSLRSFHSPFGPNLQGLFMVWTLYSPSIPGAWGGMMRAAPMRLNSAVLWVPLLSFLISVLLALLAAMRIRRNWQDKPKTRRQTETEKFFCTPVFMTGLFRRWMRCSLERNPIGWLEKRSWSGRIMSWIWLSVMISFASMFAYTVATRHDFEGFNVLMWMLLGTIAYVAAGSFRRERETGALELILVTPLSERHVIFGRLRGLWNQFLPTFAVWVIVVIYLSSAVKDWQVVNLIRFTVLYLVVPVIGLYFSLRSRFVLLSWIATLTVCVVLPQLFWSILYILLSTSGLTGLLSGVEEDTFLVPLQRLTLSSIQISLAALCLWRLRVNLARRSFSLR